MRTLLVVFALACSTPPSTPPASSGTSAPSPAPVEPAPAPAAAKDLGAQGQPCGADGCATGLTCVEYYGIAGPSGPKFTSCEIPCADPNSACPDGQGCTTIADGPGQVCRPK